MTSNDLLMKQQKSLARSVMQEHSYDSKELFQNKGVQVQVWFSFVVYWLGRWPILPWRLKFLYLLNSVQNLCLLIWILLVFQLFSLSVFCFIKKLCDTAYNFPEENLVIIKMEKILQIYFQYIWLENKKNLTVSRDWPAGLYYMLSYWFRIEHFGIAWLWKGFRGP